jgi:cell division protein ftsB homolog
VAGETSRPFLPLLSVFPFVGAPSTRLPTMRLLFVVLVGLLVLIQYPLWLGQGSWSRVWRLDQSLALQREVNAGKRLRNEGLEAEVEDLKSGRSAVEERARYGLGMVKPDEIFVQINPAPDSPATGH